MRKFIVLLSATIFFNGCTQLEVGPTGPAGADGRENIQAFIFSKRVFYDTLNRFAMDLSVPAITTHVLTNGYVRAFAKPSNAVEEYWVSLPGVLYFDLSASDSGRIDYLYRLGEITLFSRKMPLSDSLDVKVVVVQGR